MRHHGLATVGRLLSLPKQHEIRTILDIALRVATIVYSFDVHERWRCSSGLICNLISDLITACSSNARAITGLEAADSEHGVRSLDIACPPIHKVNTLLANAIYLWACGILYHSRIKHSYRKVGRACKSSELGIRNDDRTICT